MSDLKYQSGFGNHFETEALKGALPVGRNNPQKPAYGLYAEQLNGSAFTAPPFENFRSWLYRILPSACQSPFLPYEAGFLKSASEDNRGSVTPNALRWDPLDYPKKSAHFIQALRTFCVSGSEANQFGSAIHVYAANASMKREFFYNADGEMLFVPQEGDLDVHTEMGVLGVRPGEVLVVPRGVKFQVHLVGEKARGYVCENYGLPFRLPERGPIGANGLANPRDFLAPVAAYEDKGGDFKLIAKFQGQLWETEINHSPLDVVAWHGNYYPYKYDLSRFQTVNTVSFDHSDPSIFTVLTSPSERRGTANIDFVIFPPRWMVAEDTFRPPWYHCNVMSEYMGLVNGVYDAKPQGFVPGGGSLHNCMTGHGPDAETFDKASNADLKPTYQGNTMAFMFESRFVYRPTEFAMTTTALQKNYSKCWQGLKSNFRT